MAGEFLPTCYMKDVTFELTLIFLLIELTESKRRRERERETSLCCSTYLHIHWFVPLCALTWDQNAIMVYLDNALTN